MFKRTNRRASVEPEIKPKLYAEEEQQKLINELDASKVDIERLWRRSLVCLSFFFAAFIAWLALYHVSSVAPPPPAPPPLCFRTQDC
jgi:hypothetical protein